MPSPLMAALPWVALTLGTIALACYLRAAVRQLQLHRHPILLVGFALSALVPLYVVLTWAELLPDRYLHLAHPAASLAGTAAIAWVAWRLAARHRNTPARTAPLRTRLVELLLTASCLAASFALTGPELGTPIDQLTILLVLDRSRSITLVPHVDQRLALETRLAQQSMGARDRIGTVVFASNAATEDPPHPRTELPAPQRMQLSTDGTSLGEGIRRALTELPADTSARLVVLSDGVNNRGDPMTAVAAAVAAQVPIDTVALDQGSLADVRVVALHLPAHVSQGEVLELRVVTASSQPADVTVRVLRDGTLLSQGSAHIAAGEDVLRVRDVAPGAGMHNYQVELTAEQPQLDQVPDDNTASAFVRVRGQARALVLEGEQGKAAFVLSALQAAGFAVTSGNVNAVPAEVSQWAQYDLTFLSDIAAQDLAPSQLDTLAAYVRDLGGGLVLLGGDKAMGPGGFARTPIEDVSPVSFDIKQERRRASLAQVILIDYSGSMAASAAGHTKLDLANEAAARSASLLGPGDQLGVAHVDTSVTWTVPLGPVNDLASIDRAIRAVRPGGGGIYTKLALQEGFAALDSKQVNLKHVLLFADGSDAEQLPGCRQLVGDAKRHGITTSVVALGQGSDVPELELLSRLGDGRFYLIEDASRLPAVFTQETILAARSAIHEIDFRPVPTAAGPATQGIDFASSPLLKGYVVTIPKPRASVLLTGPEGDPILASWGVGVGHVSAFTSDLKDRWGAQWTSWPGAAALVAQMARAVARVEDDPHVRLGAEVVGGEMLLRADVVGDDGRAQSFRRLTARLAGPDGMSRELAMEPISAGGYGASIPLTHPGSYLVGVRDELSGLPLGTTGVSMNAGDEMRPTGTDRTLLSHISTATGGKVRDTLAGVFRDRPPARFAYRSLSGWLLVAAALTMLAGVAARRLAFPPVRRRQHKQMPAAPTEQKEAVVGMLLHQKQTRSHALHAAPTALNSRVAAAPRPPVSPATPHAAQRSAAEILLERRRGRRS